MNKEAINKYLTEAMGECWHEWNMIEDSPPFRRYVCQSCDAKAINPADNIDLYSNEGCGKLVDMFWKWDFTMQMRFFTFINKTKIRKGYELDPFSLLHAFHRDNLAPLMAEFLQGEG